MRKEGEVKSFIPRHYGFLEDEAGEIFYFDAREVHVPYRLQKGIRVDFQPMQTEKGMRAVDIQMVRRRKAWETK